MKAIIDALLDQAKKDGISRITAGAVVFIDDKLLLLRRAADDFMGGLVEFPSGKVDTNERIERRDKFDSAFNYQICG